MIDEVRKYLDHPEWRRQHRWRAAIWRNLARVGLTGIHGLPMSRRWVDIHRRAMPLVGLDPAFDGFKLVQLSDLHYSPVVWQRYLIQYVRWINEIKPDLVVVTGDLITGGYRYAQRIAQILAHIRAPHGVICTLGNHDYGMNGKSSRAEGNRRADFLEKCLVDRGLVCLRNRSVRIEARIHSMGVSPVPCDPDTGETPVLRSDLTGDAPPVWPCKPLTIVGLDDEWTNNLDADAGFAGVTPDDVTICLNHNPVNARQLLAYPWQWMLSGHTHGRQVGTGAIGRRLYPHKFRHYTHGYYSIEGRHLYVNRGLSYGQRVLDWCRPEVTVFRLERTGVMGMKANVER
jgi:predicted MPP superfamily phosphohydrolase